MAAEASIRPGSSLDTFIRGVRSGIEESSTMTELLRQVTEHMRVALKDPDLVTKNQTGILYRDPDYLFQINASVQKPGQHNPPHDHGEAWAVYGVQTGAIRMTRYERVDDGSDGDFAELKQVEEFQLIGGNADVIAPWGVHELLNTMEEPARAFIIRSRNLNDVWRNRFDLEHKTVKRVKSTRLPD